MRPWEEFAAGPEDEAVCVADVQAGAAQKHASAQTVMATTLKPLADATDVDTSSYGSRRPLPSRSVVQRSIGSSGHRSELPPGHLTRTLGISVDSPSPTSTRGSLAEA